MTAPRSQVEKFQVPATLPNGDAGLRDGPETAAIHAHHVRHVQQEARVSCIDKPADHLGEMILGFYGQASLKLDDDDTTLNALFGFHDYSFVRPTRSPSAILASIRLTNRSATAGS
jgi:hypothetical protein